MAYRPEQDLARAYGWYWFIQRMNVSIRRGEGWPEMEHRGREQQRQMLAAIIQAWLRGEGVLAQ